MPVSFSKPRLSLQPNPPRFWLGLALGLVWLAVSLAYAHATDLGSGVLGALVVCILLSSCWGGVLSGLVMTLLCSFIAVYAFLDPGSPPYLDKQGVFGLGSFLLAAAIVNAYNFWRRRVEEKLVQARKEIARVAEELQEAVNRKDEFLSLVVHELRNPLSVVLGESVMLNRGELSSGDRILALKDIQSESERLTSLLQNLSALARIEGKSGVELEPLRLATVVSRVVAEESRRMSQEIVFKDFSDNVMVEGSERSVDQVLRNLLSNAAKYSPPGSLVEVSVLARAQDAVVSVLNCGSGVDKREASYLFEPFYRSQNTRSQPGMGIGLTVCKRLVTEMKGDIWIETGDERVCFSFSLPRQPLSEAHTRAEAASSREPVG